MALPLLGSNMLRKAAVGFVLFECFDFLIHWFFDQVAAMDDVPQIFQRHQIIEWIFIHDDEISALCDLRCESLISYSGKIEQY